MEVFFETNDELFHMLIQIRAKYMPKMKEPGFSQDTLADTITEVGAYIIRGVRLTEVWKSMHSP